MSRPQYLQKHAPAELEPYRKCDAVSGSCVFRSTNRSSSPAGLAYHMQLFNNAATATLKWHFYKYGYNYEMAKNKLNRDLLNNNPFF